MLHYSAQVREELSFAGREFKLVEYRARVSGKQLVQQPCLVNMKVKGRLAPCLYWREKLPVWDRRHRQSDYFFRITLPDLPEWNHISGMGWAVKFVGNGHSLSFSPLNKLRPDSHVAVRPMDWVVLLKPRCYMRGINQEEMSGLYVANVVLRVKHDRLITPAPYTDENLVAFSS
jgi:hypothetical protein